MIRRATKKDAIYVAEMAEMIWESHSVEELIREFETEIDNEECVVYILRGCRLDSHSVDCAMITWKGRIAVWLDI